MEEVGSFGNYSADSQLFRVLGEPFFHGIHECPGDVAHQRLAEMPPPYHIFLYGDRVVEDSHYGGEEVIS